MTQVMKVCLVPRFSLVLSIASSASFCCFSSVNALRKFWPSSHQLLKPFFHSWRPNCTSGDLEISPMTRLLTITWSCCFILREMQHTSPGGRRWLLVSKNWPIRISFSSFVFLLQQSRYPAIGLCFVREEISQVASFHVLAMNNPAFFSRPSPTSRFHIDILGGNGIDNINQSLQILALWRWHWFHNGWLVWSKKRMASIHTISMCRLHYWSNVDQRKLGILQTVLFVISIPPNQVLKRKSSIFINLVENLLNHSIMIDGANHRLRPNIEVFPVLSRQCI